MNNGVSGNWRSSPPVDDDQTLSPRDRLLIRVEELLAEQCLMPFPGQEERDEGEPAELIDVEAVVEIVQLPPSAIRPSSAARQPSPSAVPPPPVSEAASSPPAAGGSVKVKATTLSVILQSFILLLVIVWVFIFGILIGRGRLWESGLGHDLVVWLESKAGWDQQSGPEVVLQAAGAESGHQDQIVDDHDPMLDDELIELDGPVPSPGLTGASPPATVAAAQFNMARLVQNVVLDWSGRQWFDEEAARRRAEAGGGQGPGPGGGSGSEPGRETGASAQATAAASAGNEKSPSASDAPPGAELPEAVADSAARDTRFAVQVVLAHDEDEAKRRVERLEQQGFIAYYYKNANGRLPVRVGHFPTRKAAEEALARLKTLGYDSPYISSLSN